MKVFIGFLILFGSCSARSVKTKQLAQCIDTLVDDLLPIFEDCTQFYLCKNGKAILKECKEGLYFDSQTKNCTEASLSDCVQEQPSTVSNLEVESNVTEFPTYICLGKAIGSLVPSRSNCSEYFFCISSTPALRTCGKDFHFDPYSQSCISSNISECVVKVRPPETTTRKPELIETVCKGMFDGEKYPVPGSCSKYFDCLEHKAYEKSCHENKHFYPVSRTCIDAAVSECFDGDVRLNLTFSHVVGENNNEFEFFEQENTTTDIGITENSFEESNYVNVSDSSYLSIANNRSTGENSKSFGMELGLGQVTEDNLPKSVENKACKGVSSWTLLASASSCHEFITCKDGNGYLTPCPHGLHFNAKRKICDLPDSAGCLKDHERK